MKKCPRCGQQIKEEDHFCPHCGLDLRGKYLPIHHNKKGKGHISYILYFVILFSMMTIPFMYSRLLNNVSRDIQQFNQSTRVELGEISENDPTMVIAQFDSLEGFQKQYSNVDAIVNSIQEYEESLTQDHQYTYEKKYIIQVLDNNNVYYHLEYVTQLTDHLTMTIVKEYDRGHNHNDEKIKVRKGNVNSFEELFFNEGEKPLVEVFTGQQAIIEKVMNDFSLRKDEFESKKETLGHYGIGNYEDHCSFVVHRQDQLYYSLLTYSSQPKDYIN